jgi:DNA-directed RNA polymerase specialized sigma24 family protein
MSHEEVSAQTGQPLGTVKSHVRRGLRRIRAMLLGVEDEEETS